MGELMRAHDWSSTPFGDPSAWPQSLRSAVSICLGTSFPIALYWGQELALLYNDAWSAIPGDKHPWALGKPGREVWPEIWAEIGPLYEKVQQTGEGVWQEDQLLPMRRYGYTEECYFNFTFSPVRGEDGGVDGIFNAVVETTFRVIGERRERTLRELAERMSTARSEKEVFAVAVEMFAAKSADVPFALLYRLDTASDVAELVGLAGVSGNNAASPERIDIRETNSAWPTAAILEGRSEVVDGLSSRFGYPLPGGPWPEPTDRALLVPIMAPLPDRSVSGFLVAGVSPRRDLDADYRAFIERAASHVATALINVRAFEQERKRAEALAEIDRAKTAFFSNVSHEFRTPLTLMLGPLEEALADAAIPQRSRVQLDLAHRNSRRLLRLVNSLLDFSRIEAGRAAARYQPTDLATFSLDIASSFRSAMEKAGLVLKLECPPLPQPVYIDREMWEKVLLNLLSNAFKFTLAGFVSMTVRPGSDGHAACIEVQDSGIGIPADELPRLFERFHRVEGAQGRSIEGSGIGLALVQDLVKLHGGSIAVSSELGRGTTFAISLPFGKAHLLSELVDDDAPVSEAPNATRAHEYADELARLLSGADVSLLPPADVLGEQVHRVDGDGRGRGKKIVLADDNTDMRSYLQRLLEAEGYAVTPAADGEDAYAAIEKSSPDLVLSDVMMPKLDGFGLLSRLRADPRLADLPVLLLSARAGGEAQVEGLEAGADDYLAKPFAARELLARINSNIHMAEIRRQLQDKLKALNVDLERRVVAEVAERMKIEEVLRQAQKMEAVGQLTGGVAHDFNNLLTIIVGGLDTIRRAKPEEHARIKRAADMAFQGAQRAASLTGRLLAFSRRQPLAPKPLDLNVLVRDMTELLHRTLGEQIELEGVLAPRLWPIEADSNQLESAILNLAVNARDAMQDGGKLTIETANTYLDERYVETAAEVVPGQYVVISVSDSGSGIPKEDLSRVFEPFYTTKEVGRGTGLGLSMVYGFVKQSGGHVTIYSELGHGTAVKMYFPRFHGADVPEEILEAQTPGGSDGEVVLVVEDNEDVRAYSVMILGEMGYTVLQADDADGALAILSTNQRIDLLFTDVVLPGRSGKVLADEASKLRPRLKVLFTTGYSRNAIVHQGRIDPGVKLLSKPFTYEQLAACVRDVLDEH